MRHWLFFLIMLTAAAVSVSAKTTTVYEPPFRPQSAEIMAQGGSFNANGSGFYSLFSNPASFADKDASLTVLSTSPWLYALPTAAVVDSLGGMIEDPESGIIGLNDLLTGPGFGAGVSVGVGYVGNGLGLGLVNVADVFAQGPNTLGVHVDSHITVGFIGGFALPVRLGPVTLKIGGAFRPMYRVHVPELGIGTFARLLGDDSDGIQINEPVYHGVGLALDAGTIVTLGPLSVGVALRDLFGTAFSYSESTVTELMDALKAVSLPEGGELVGDEVRFVVPMTVHAGATFHPNLGAVSRIIDPAVHLNWEYPVTPGQDTGSLWTSLHAGTEVDFFSRIRLRAGINQGYLTAGAGIHLFFADFNVAYFGRELGSFAGSKQNQGITAELALRF